MTWDELAIEIARMPKKRRHDAVVFVADFFGSDRRAVYLELLRSKGDVWAGVSVGNEIVVHRGEWMFADVDENASAER